MSRDLDILLISESHLTPQISSAVVSIPGFDVLRNDSGSTAKHGVCAFVRDNLRVDNVDASHPNVLSFRITAVNVYVLVIYRPPSNSHEQNDALASFLTDFCVEKEALLIGDFNLPSLDWSSQQMLRTASATDLKFVNVFDTLGLTQWITSPTFPRSNNTLDLILTTDPDRIGDTEVRAPPPGCDHCSIHCDYVFDADIQDRTHVPLRYIWHRGNYHFMSKVLMDTDWDFEFAFLSASEAFNKLKDIVKPLISQYIPLKKCSFEHQHKVPWNTNPPTSLRNQRKQAWEAYKHYRNMSGRKSQASISALQDFFVANKAVRHFAYMSQVEYEKSLISRSKDNPKLLHSYIRHKKQYRSSLGPLRTASLSTTDDPKEMANGFLEAFASVFSASCLEHPARHQTCPNGVALDNIEFTIEDVAAVLHSLDHNSSMGPDGIHPQLLKSCAEALTYPLYKIFCMSLAEGSLPAEWKTSHVIPIFKKGSRYDPLNYRPVSLTSVPGKCMERLVCREILKYLDEHDVLSNEQFGFRPGRCTEDQLLLTYNDITESLNEGYASDLILFDFSKAFDRVSHSVLLEKLKCLGFTGHVISWIKDFLVGRTMKVMVKDTFSDPTVVLSGVPQGSVLGPVLFLLFINHIAVNLTCKYKIFADDLKIYTCVDPCDTSGKQAAGFQCDVKRLHETAESWGLKMNLRKCAVLSFRRRFHPVCPPTYILGDCLIPAVSSQTDLGIIVDAALKFHEHARSTAQKAGAVAQNLLKSTVCRTPEFMMHLLRVHIRPIIEYASVVWNTGYVQDRKKLESVQRLWTRQVLGLEGKNYGERLKALDLFSVEGRLLRADLIKCWKVFHGLCPIQPSDLWEVSSDSRTRGHQFKIKVVRCEIDCRARFFSNRIISDWNSLPDWVVGSASVGEFKSSLATVLGERLFRFTA